MPDEITIRKAEDADISIVRDFLLKLDAHVAGVSPDVLDLSAEGERQLGSRIENLINSPDHYLMIADDRNGHAVGMADLTIWVEPELWNNPERRGRRYGYLDDFWIEPAFRGEGIAQRMVAVLVDIATREGIGELILEYSVHNTEAERFWRQLGFAPTGVRASARLTDVGARLQWKGGPPENARSKRKTES